MKRLVSVLLIILFSGVLPTPRVHLVEEVAYAKTSQLDRARQNFSQGDIVATYSLLRKSVSSLGQADRIEALKLLGICAYLMGRKGESQDFFSDALRLDPNTQLNPRDILDPAIKSVFEGIRDSNRKRTPSRGSRTAETKSPQAAPSVSSSASTVTVTANAPGATVFANGLFVGTTGSPIELKPGNYNLTVSAAGFNPATKNISLSKGQKLNLNVTLVDPIELRKQQLLEARKRRLAAQAAERQKRLQEAAEARAREEERRRILAQELEAKRLEEAAQRAREEERLKAIAAQKAAEEMALQKAAEARRREDEQRQRLLAAQIAARKQAEAELRELERQEAEARAKSLNIQPASRAKRPNKELDYSSDLPSGQQSLADEFKRDQSAPPAQYAPQYPQAYPTPPPSYGAQPPYPQQPDQAYQPPAQSSYGPRYPQAKRRQKTSDKSTFLAFMPFGIGQFQNDDYGLGTASALAQVASLGFGIFEYTLVEAQQRTFEEWAAANQQNSSNESQAYIDETQAYLDQHRQLMAIGFIGFGAIWLASGIEALVSINDQSRSYSSLWLPEEGPAVTPQTNTQIRPFAFLDGRFGLEISTPLR